MKGLAFGIGILALGFAATTPARADYALVRFNDGFCKIWWDAAATPWGDGWAKIAITPDWPTAWAALNTAISAGTCH